MHASYVSTSVSIESSTKGNIQKTQRSLKYDRRLQNEVHPCESLELAAILDAILDFEKNAQWWAQFTRQILLMWCLKLQNQMRKKLYQPSKG